MDFDFEALRYELTNNYITETHPYRDVIILYCRYSDTTVHNNILNNFFSRLSIVLHASFQVLNVSVTRACTYHQCTTCVSAWRFNCENKQTIIIHVRLCVFEIIIIIARYAVQTRTICDAFTFPAHVDSKSALRLVAFVIRIPKLVARTLSISRYPNRRLIIPSYSLQVYT